MDRGSNFNSTRNQNERTAREKGGIERDESVFFLAVIEMRKNHESGRGRPATVTCQNRVIPFTSSSAQRICESNMRVEFLGLPRERTGIAELELEADTLGQLLALLAARFPPLGDLIAGDCLRASFVANLNGDRFVSDPRTQLREEDCVLILSADAGG